ncbi:carboxy-S-adenosyl-L-methionine synthase CmoA [Helicobacter fennelliae]
MAQHNSKDTLFTAPTHKQFEFDERVASVFDDMLTRSIPFYRENLKLCVDFLALNAPCGRIYDLGCSTGNMLFELYERLKDSHRDSYKNSYTLIGIDSSSAMIENAKLKAQACNADITFINADCMEVEFLDSRAFIANYTMQFIRPINRLHLIKKLYNALEFGGVLLMSEKMSSTDSVFDKQMIEYYHAYKAKNGYTQSEITRKREALENVLVPYSLEENLALLKDAGFKGIEVLFKWVNFGTLIAKK